MPVDLRELVESNRTAVLVSECQEGLIGEVAPAALKIGEAVRSTGMLPRLAGLLTAARSVNVPIFYCVIELRPDRRGRAGNMPLERAFRDGLPLVRGTPGARVVAELAPQEQDFVISRIHGITSFPDTGLDSQLRNLGIGTIVLTGISVNLAIPGTAMEAVNRGYRVVVPSDCVAGTPLAYAEAVIANSLRSLAHITTASDLANAWQGSGGRG